MAILSGHARLAGVIGWPVAHSRSPRLHGFWLDRYGIDGTYVPLAVRPADFETAVRGLVAAGFAGANVTIPHKEAAFAVCDWNGRIAGRNTDGIGFLENLRQHGIDPAAGPALLLGAGGAARAIAAALRGLGVDVTLTNRTAGRAEALAEAVPGCRTTPWNTREDALADQALIVNTTSLGMIGHDRLVLDLGRAAATAAVSDIVYVPLETPLVTEAKTRGLKTAPGLGMLLHQAVPGFAAWFGVTPVVDEALYDFVAADLLTRRAM
jgi:shikimate dehydrogenase